MAYARTMSQQTPHRWPYRGGLILVSLVGLLLLVASRLVGPAAAAGPPIVRELYFEAVDEQRSRTVPIKVYLAQSKTPQPIVLFSHGLGGSRENNAYLGKHWAAAGYVAVFMQHPGSDVDVMKQARGVAAKLAALKAAVGIKASRDRFGDVSFVIDQLQRWNEQAGHELQGTLDPDKIGMSGHSYGAVTTLAVAGQKFPWNLKFHDPRIDAFLAMSPQPGKGLPPDGAFGHIKSPVLCMTGTKDASPIDKTLKPSMRQHVFAALPAGDKFQLVLKDGEHFAFGDSRGLRTRNRNPQHHEAIQQISLHFWNAYLKGDDNSRQWLRSQRPITASGLGAGDVWQWK